MSEPNRIQWGEENEAVRIRRSKTSENDHHDVEILQLVKKNHKNMFW